MKFKAIVLAAVLNATLFTSILVYIKGGSETKFQIEEAYFDPLKGTLMVCLFFLTIFAFFFALISWTIQQFTPKESISYANFF